MLTQTTLLLFLVLGCQTAPDLKIKRSQICEGNTALLLCESGYMTIFSANYGRTDRTTCSIGQPSDQSSNVFCFQQTSHSIVSARCEGQQACSVPAMNSVFSNPCVGTHKYLDVSYLCLPYKRTVVCEKQEDEISCDSGLIFIHHANYGRRDPLTCLSILGNTSNCFNPQTFNLRSRCNGKTSCKLKASSDVFSDPCLGVSKYLEVTYSCT